MSRTAVIIGYGSIGARHARLLTELGVAVNCVTGNPDCPYPVRPDIATALSAGADLVIIANRTAVHADALAELARLGFAGDVLVEKPLTGGFGAVPEGHGMSVAVAYNLRFHPLVQRLRAGVSGAVVLGTFRAGQYLPNWRPAADYRTSYSSSAAGGGGVLRDLSHELDLALWLCGPWRRVSASLGRSGLLEIETEDSASLLVETTTGATVTINVDYLVPKPVRQIELLWRQDGVPGQAIADLVGGTLRVGDETQQHTTERDETYRAQLQHLLTGDRSVLCSLDEGRMVDALILAAERSSQTGAWVERDVR